ncbi:MAG TPA: trypsin-like peptidase domain-containing protein [Syntrophorhabdaceae bacterium]|nr:trypsin-like peptidase domain-containing protein [Syntrophorhabdaceae bacterium]
MVLTHRNPVLPIVVFTVRRNTRSAALIFLFLAAVTGWLLPQKCFAAEDRVVQVVEKAGKAIVFVKTEELSQAPDEEQKPSLLRKYFGSEEDTGELVPNKGSGVVLDPRGIVVTNEHLIERAINIRVKFVSGKEYDAYVLASDPEFDIALLKIITSKPDFPYLTIGPKRTVRVGEKAIVIGSPFELTSSVTVGVISFIGRNLRIEGKVYADLIQTDAAINPGNSGGALLDGDGNLLGIVTAIYGEGKGIGFAIPIDDVAVMLSEFLENSPKRPILGLFFEKRKDERGAFLFVSKVIQGSPAMTYGLKEGDRITEINKKTIKEGTKPHSIMRGVEDEGALQLRISRGLKKYTMNVDAADLEKYTPLPIDEALCGMRVSDIKGYPKLKYKLRDKEGVVVTRVLSGGIAERSGLKSGDVIVKINNNTIKDSQDFNSFMVEGLKRNYILYQVRRNDSLFFVPVKLDTLL